MADVTPRGRAVEKQKQKRKPGKKRNLKKEVLRPDKPPKPPVERKFLTQPDLVQFNLRRQAVQQVALSSSMIQAGYVAWSTALKMRYGLEGPFDVNPQTGEIVLRPPTKED